MHQQAIVVAIKRKAYSQIDWGRAACRGLDTKQFYPSPNMTRAPYRVRVICDACPIKVECGEYGVKYGEWGVWGGHHVQSHERGRANRDLIEQANQIMKQNSEKQL